MIASCPHCWTAQAVDGPTTCVNPHCRHRADIPANECDCSQCRPHSVEECVLAEKDDDPDDTDLFPIDLGGRD